MNILLISGSYSNLKDGISDGAKIIRDELSKKHQVKIITTDLCEIHEVTDEYKENEVEYVKNWKICGHMWQTIKNNLNGIDVVHIEYPGVAYKKEIGICLLPYLLKKYRKIHGCSYKIVVRLHEYTQARMLRKIVIRPILSHADKILIPSNIDYEYLKNIYGKKIRKTLIGSNIFVKEYKTNMAINQEFNISYFGFIYPNKGFEDILRIWDKINKKYTEKNIKFTIIGDFNEKNNRFKEYHEELYSHIKSYGLENKIHITGYMSSEAVSEQIALTDLAILLYKDGLTLRRGSFIAYIKHGIPVITSKGDDECQELFKESSGIKMCENESDVMSAVESIIDMTTDEYMQMAKDNVKKSEVFDWEAIVNDITKVYEE